MSRIHEALKKAEQEKGADRHSGSPPLPVAREDVNLRRMPPAVTGATERLAPPAPGIEEWVGPLSVEAFEARCVRHLWKPDPAVLPAAGSQNHGQWTEQFRTLRSRLYQLRDVQPVRTLLVTSPLPREGKTFISANLAQVFVRQRERRALLIDADLRWSRLHTVLGAPSSPGLSDYLRGEANEFAVIQRGPQENLYFIPGGPSVSNAAELISNGRLKTLLNRLKPVFDWIILDSPPVVPVSDANVIADLCDGVLLVVAAAQTPFDVAQKARQQFRDKHLLGVVLNRADRRSSHDYYAYSYYGGEEKKKKAKR